MEPLSRIWRRLANMSPLPAGLVIFAIALLVRLAFLFVFHTYTDLNRYELERTAISLAQTGVYGNPYAIPTGPSAHVAPGYTLILAAIFKLFGTGIPAEIVKRLFASIVSSALWALLPAVATRLSLPLSAGILAGLIGAIYPARPLVEIDGDWETPYIALALVLIAVLSYQLWTKRDLRIKQAWIHGFAWGVALLFVPALLDIFAVFACVGLYFSRGVNLKRYLTFVAIEIVAVAACLSPWVIRNDRALGSPVVTRTNLGLELRISNNDQASPDQRVNFLNGLFERYHPLQSKQEALKVKEMGELAYNKQAGDEAKAWMRAHPVKFLELCLGRARCYWLYYDPTSRFKTVFLAATNVLGLIGFFFVWKYNRIAAVVIALILILYPLPNYLVHVGLRQEYPIEWLTLLLASICLLQWFDPAEADPSARQASTPSTEPRP